MRYFGTDGIRGRVGEDPMTVDFTLRLASAAAGVLAPQGGGTVLIANARHCLFNAQVRCRFRCGH
jgi:phosphoglucosamine mutase